MKPLILTSFLLSVSLASSMSIAEESAEIRVTRSSYRNKAIDLTCAPMKRLANTLKRVFGVPAETTCKQTKIGDLYNINVKTEIGDTTVFCRGGLPLVLHLKYHSPAEIEASGKLVPDGDDVYLQFAKSCETTETTPLIDDLKRSAMTIRGSVLVHEIEPDVDMDREMGAVLARARYYPPSELSESLSFFKANNSYFGYGDNVEDIGRLYPLDFGGITTSRDEEHQTLSTESYSSSRLHVVVPEDHPDLTRLNNLYQQKFEGGRPDAKTYELVLRPNRYSLNLSHVLIPEPLLNLPVLAHEDSCSTIEPMITYSSDYSGNVDWQVSEGSSTGYSSPFGGLKVFEKFIRNLPTAVNKSHDSTARAFYDDFDRKAGFKFAASPEPDRFNRACLKTIGTAEQWKEDLSKVGFRHRERYGNVFTRLIIDFRRSSYPLGFSAIYNQETLAERLKDPSALRAVIKSMKQALNPILFWGGERVQNAFKEALVEAETANNLANHEILDIIKDDHYDNHSSFRGLVFRRRLKGQLSQKQITTMIQSLQTLVD